MESQRLDELLSLAELTQQRRHGQALDKNRELYYGKGERDDFPAVPHFFGKAQRQGQSECATQSPPEHRVLMPHSDAVSRLPEERAQGIDGRCAPSSNEDHCDQCGKPDEQNILAGLVHSDQQEHEGIRDEGGVLPETLDGMHETSQNILLVWLPALVAVVFVTAGRAAAIYPLCTLFWKSGYRVTVRHQHAMFWGGLRGALALALALGLPEGVPHRAEIITVSFAVVAFSIFVQGLTMTPLLRKLGETQ